VSGRDIAHNSDGSGNARGWIAKGFKGDGEDPVDNPGIEVRNGGNGIGTDRAAIDESTRSAELVEHAATYSIRQRTSVERVTKNDAVVSGCWREAGEVEVVDGRRRAQRWDVSDQ